MIPKIAICVSHPIQHFCPQYASLAKSDLWQSKIFFMSRLGSESYVDKDFGKLIKWDNLYLDEFDHQFISDTKCAVPMNQPAEKLIPSLEVYLPNVVIIYGYRHLFQREVKDWAQKNNILVYYISDSEFNHGESWLRKSAKFILNRKFFKSIDRFLTVGEANERYYSFFYIPKSKMTRMNFPIDIKFYYEKLVKRKSLRMSVREQYGIEEDEFTGIMVGKLMSKKNQIMLYRLLQEIEDKYNFTMSILCVGSGVDLKSLKQMSLKLKNCRIIFTDFVSPEKLPALYAASDVYIHTAFYEPHSLAISEAIYIGLPLIISDTCGSYGSDDDLIPEINGFVYKNDSTSELAQFVVKLESDRSLLLKFGRESEKYAKKAQKLAHGGFLNHALKQDNILLT